MTRRFLYVFFGKSRMYVLYFGELWYTERRNEQVPRLCAANDKENVTEWSKR